MMLVNAAKKMMLLATLLASQIMDAPLAYAFTIETEVSERLSSSLCSQVNQSTHAGLPLDYSNLERLLRQQNWQAADEETLNLILKATGQEDRGWIGETDMETFPCSVLQDIDELWLQYSDGHFGFSIQAAIEQECYNENSDFYPTAMRCLAETIGWPDWERSQLDFSLSAPEGHLPATHVYLGRALYEACGENSATGDASNDLSPEELRQCSLSMMTFAYVSPLALIYAADCDYFANTLSDVDAVYEQTNLLYNQANELRDQGQLEEAETAFRQAIELRPRFVEAYNNLGVVVGMQGRLDEAYEIFLRTLELDPNHASGYSNLGMLFFLWEDFDQSVEAYRQAIQLDPSDVSNYDGLGLSLRKQGNLEKAIAAFQQALEIQPDCQRAQNHLRETQQLLHE